MAKERIKSTLPDEPVKVYRNGVIYHWSRRYGLVRVEHKPKSRKWWQVWKRSKEG